MSDNSEMVDDKETSLTAVTDDLCTVKYIEIVPIDRPADDYCKPEFIETVVAVKSEDFEDVKQRLSDDYCKPQFIEPVVEVKPEDLQDVKHTALNYYCKPQLIERVVEVKPEDLKDVKQEPADESDFEAAHYFKIVRFQKANCFNYWSIKIYCIYGNNIAGISVGQYSDNRKKLQFITLLTAISIVSHIENSKNDEGYIT